ncbi:MULTISPECIES: transposase [unclassified Streptomyces]|uniref:transposase n=1 Tax=unclassified Streptomyces TaxID=2593676 RepID=UPI0030D43E51
MNHIPSPVPPALTAEEKAGIVLSVLSGRETVAEAAGRHAHLSERSLLDWREAFIEGGLRELQGSAARRPPPRASLLEAEAAELKSALGEVCLELNVWHALRTRPRRRPDPG